MNNERPSRTAEYMALFRAVESARPAAGRLFEDPYAAALLTGRLKALAGFARLPVVGPLATWFLDLGWPRTRSSAVVRTRLIDDLLREAVRGGARQALLLGAGFDSRPYRLEELRGVPVFEVDHPSTQSAKRRRLEARLGSAARQRAVRAGGFRKGRPGNRAAPCGVRHGRENRSRLGRRGELPDGAGRGSEFPHAGAHSARRAAC